MLVGSETVQTEGGIRGSLLRRVPVPLPVVHAPPLCSLDANRRGPRSPRNEHSQLQWRALRAQLGSPGPDALPYSPRPWRTAQVSPAPAVLTVRPTPTPTSRTGPRDRDCLQVKHKGKQIHPTETIQAVSQLIWVKVSANRPHSSLLACPGRPRLEESPGSSKRPGSLGSLAVRQSGGWTGKLCSRGQEFESHTWSFCFKAAWDRKGRGLDQKSLFLF